MKLNFALAKIAQGIFNAEDAAVALDESGTPITPDLFNELKAAEKAYISAKYWPVTDCEVKVIGVNGNQDFIAIYRGKCEGRAMVVFKGMQMTVPFDQITKPE